MADPIAAAEDLSTFTTDVQDLCFQREIPSIEGPPDPLEFYRTHVSRNWPCVMKNAIGHWPALKLWSDSDYLQSRLGEKEVTVAVTPTGYADAIVDNCFVTPFELKMKMHHFLEVLAGRREKSPKGVYYIQKQNSNFVEEFAELHVDAEVDLPWATRVFGGPPDAVNFWMGEKEAVTSMHKDHYENLYCVVTGEKHFILHSPADVPYIPHGRYAVDESGQFAVVKEAGAEVPWVSVDPESPLSRAQHPQYSRASRWEVTVRAGEVLYLPSLWYHHVRQAHGTIAVNFWYDMEFDLKYCYYKLLENLTQPVLKKLNTGPTASDQSH